MTWEITGSPPGCVANAIGPSIPAQFTGAAERGAVGCVEFFTAHSRHPHKRKAYAEAAAFLRATRVELAATLDRDKVSVSAGQASGSLPG